MVGTVRAAALAFGVLSVCAVGCSGGGGGGDPVAPPSPPAVSPPPTSPPPTSNPPTWTSGVFEPASVFKDQCEVPRSGIDIEGNAFPDQAGSLLEENFWLRSWSNETYLWNTDIVDQDPILFDDRLEYFDELRTFETTPSGRFLDEFHFTQPTDEYLEDRNAAPTATYGARYIAFSTSPPRDFRVLYNDPGSPAAQITNGLQALPRGARILEVDGVDLVNGADIDTLNAGLFPATANETHTFVVQDDGAATARTVTLVSADLAPVAVNRTRVIDTPNGSVGYVLLNTFGSFTSEEELFNAINTLQNAGVQDLILDLRYNGGGLLAVASQLSYMVAGDARTAGRTYERLRFNDDAGNINPVTGEVNDPLPFFNQGLGFSLASGTPLPTLNLPRVFILSTERTCSASESVINSLRGIDVEVILIGDITCGKPFGFFPQDNCGETYFTVQFQGVNDQGFGDFADGFAPANSTNLFAVETPGCLVADDLGSELGDGGEALLAAALQFRADGSCPAPPVSQGSTTSTFSASNVGAAISASGLTPAQEFVRTSKDMTMPSQGR